MTRVVLPGDFLQLTINEPKIGRGITKLKNGELMAVQPGILHESDKKVFVDVYSTRYIPVEGDKVIGVVMTKGGDFYKLDIGAADMAMLSYLAFEGATKKNRPNVKTGDLIYGIIKIASRHIEPEVIFPKKMSCVSNEDHLRAHCMGVLPNGGFNFKVPLNFARRLLADDKNSVLTLLGNTKFECAVGMNGQVWLKANSPDEILEMRTFIQKVSVYHGKVEIEDFEYDEPTYRYPCPCGDQFEIAKEQLESGEDVATCPTCSLPVRVIYDIEKFAKMKTVNVAQVTAASS